MKIALDAPKDRRRIVTYWKACAPFVENQRGVLIHRPRTVTVHRTVKHAHIAVHYYCGNASTGTKNFTFLDEPPADALLCARCEAEAVKVGLPSAHALCGKHVHEGKCVAVQTCCIGG